MVLLYALTVTRSVLRPFRSPAEGLLFSALTNVVEGAHLFKPNLHLPRHPQSLPRRARLRDALFPSFSGYGHSATLPWLDTRFFGGLQRMSSSPVTTSPGHALGLMDLNRRLSLLCQATMLYLICITTSIAILPRPLSSSYPG